MMIEVYTSYYLREVKPIWLSIPDNMFEECKRQVSFANSNAPCSTCKGKVLGRCLFSGIVNGIPVMVSDYFHIALVEKYRIDRKTLVDVGTMEEY